MKQVVRSSEVHLITLNRYRYSEQRSCKDLSLEEEFANVQKVSLDKTTSEQAGAGITSIQDVVAENTVSIDEQIVSAGTSVEQIPAIAADGNTIEAINLAQTNQPIDNPVETSSTDSLEQQLVKTTSEQVEAACLNS